MPGIVVFRVKFVIICRNPLKCSAIHISTTFPLLSG